MGNILTFFEFSSTEKNLQNQITYFLETMLTEEDNQSKQFAYYSLSKSSTLKIFSFLEAIMKAPLLTEFMGFMMSVKEDIIYKYGNSFLPALITFRLRL